MVVSAGGKQETVPLLLAISDFQGLISIFVSKNLIAKSIFIR